MDAPLDITFTSPEDWTYISEGGATLVLSYRGAYHQGLTGMVLRLRKERLHKPDTFHPSFTDLESHDADHSEQPLGHLTDQSYFVERAAFQEEIIAKYISPIFLPRFRIACADESWLRKLSKIVETLRPLGRREVDRISCHQHKAILATDLVGRQGLVIEIKVSITYLLLKHYYNS